MRECEVDCIGRNRGRAGIFARKLYGGHNTLPRDYVCIPQVVYGAGWVPCRSLDAPIAQELRRRYYRVTRQVWPRPGKAKGRLVTVASKKETRETNLAVLHDFRHYVLDPIKMKDIGDLLSDKPIDGADAIRSIGEGRKSGGKVKNKASSTVWDGEAEKIAF
ncbi:hypothetical protein B0H14DRAFT_3133312 [Mycena olivaceomarginata]|nr:hypothetical protein B0H14DRAFT_3133312 [Mycena olivaceomarginata]